MVEVSVMLGSSPPPPEPCAVPCAPDMARGNGPVPDASLLFLALVGKEGSCLPYESAAVR